MSSSFQGAAFDEMERAYSAFVRAAARVRRELRAGHKALLDLRMRQAAASVQALGVLPPAADDLRAIQTAVAKFYGLEVPVLASRARDRESARARFVAMRLCRELTAWSSPKIGAAFARDHGMVLHACETVANETSVDGKFALEYEIVKQRAREALDALGMRKAAA